ncbi:esterase/lipase family protein [Spirillospora sp. NPDC127200]
MLAHEIRGLGDLAGAALKAGADRVRQTHQGIAGRVFRNVGPVSTPVRIVHDGISAAVYTGVGGALSAGGRTAGAVLADVAGDGFALRDAPRGRIVLSLLNGWHGDRLDQDGNGLALPMTVRAHGRDVPVETRELAEAHRPATGRIAVFLHGLVENEGAWAYKSVRHHGRPGVTYGDLLRADLGYTPVQVRYNTGLRISANGGRLDALLAGLVEAWPVPVEDLLLIGHSMGGLVIRSALAQAAERGSAWPSAVRDTVTLGTPHLGAPLERGAALLTHALDRAGETRAVAAVLAARSAGIKDLRHGSLLEADWADRHPDALGGPPPSAVPLHEGARHFVVVGTVTRRPGSPVGDLLGDLLVRPRSACGEDAGERRLDLPGEHVCRVAGVHHFDLLNHPEVYARIRDWLTDRPADEPAGGEAAG